MASCHSECGYLSVHPLSCLSTGGRVWWLHVTQNVGTYQCILCLVCPQEIEFGGFMLQQNVGGHPVAVYRFPPRTKFPPNSTITVYAGCNDHKLHNPPQDFVWKEQQKWGTGPECTTILCRPNGQVKCVRVCVCVCVCVCCVCVCVCACCVCMFVCV